jgi:hypothetical protein
MPAGAVEHEDDDAVAARARLAGEGREPIVGKAIHWIAFRPSSYLEERLVDAVRRWRERRRR